MVARLTEPWNAGSACYLRILGEISPCLTGPEVSRSLQTRNEQVRGSTPHVGFKEEPHKWRGCVVLGEWPGRSLRSVLCASCVPPVVGNRRVSLSRQVAGQSTVAGHRNPWA